MKKNLLFLLAAVPFFAAAQVRYSVKGRLENINSPAKIFLFYRDGGKSATDSAKIKNHEFEFKGNIADTANASLIIDYKGGGLSDIWKKQDVDQLQVYLVNAITMVSATDSLYKANISGNKLNEEFYQYNLVMRPVIQKFRVATTDEQYNTATIQRNELSKRFLAAHPDSYVSLTNALQNIAAGYINIDEVYPLFTSLSKNVRSTKSGVFYKKFLDAVKRVAVGATAPEFAQADTNGKPVKLSAFKGKYVLVDFWASWCGPCRAENPNVVKTYNKYKGKNFTILSVSLDRPGAKSNWLGAIHKDNLAWNHVSDLKFWSNQVAILYGIQAIPQNFLLDPDGKIIAKNVFGNDLDKKLEEIFGKI